MITNLHYNQVSRRPHLICTLSLSKSLACIITQEVVVALSRYVQQYEQRFLSAALTYTDDLVAKAMQRVSICEDEESLSNSVISCKFWSRTSRFTIIFVNYIRQKTDSKINLHDRLYFDRYF